MLRPFDAVRKAMLAEEMRRLQQVKLDRAVDGYQAIMDLEEQQTLFEQTAAVLQGRHREAKLAIEKADRRLQELQREFDTIVPPPDPPRPAEAPPATQEPTPEPEEQAGAP